MNDVANIITNAEVVGTVRIGNTAIQSHNAGPRYDICNSTYFSCNPNNYSVTLQPGTYLLIVGLAATGADVGTNYVLQFADMSIIGTVGGSAIKYKIVTLTSPTTYTHTTNVGSYAVGTCTCVKLN